MTIIMNFLILVALLAVVIYFAFWCWDPFGMQRRKIGGSPK